MATRMASILGLFKEAEAAAEAISLLREVGFSPAEYDVLTGTPYPEGAFGESSPGHKLFVFPFLGAAVGFAAGILLTVGTQLSYPLVTGGKPLLSIPPMAIITYEGTMLGAILFTVLGIIFESRLPQARLEPYDRRITEGYIGVLVSCPQERVGAAEGALRRAGAEEVKYHGER